MSKKVGDRPADAPPVRSVPPSDGEQFSTAATEGKARFDAQNALYDALKIYGTSGPEKLRPESSIVQNPVHSPVKACGDR